MRPLISIIVPIYNLEREIPGCIESIIAQTYDNLEIFLIDDGSLDNSGAICDRYAEADNRIIVMHRENGGVSAARNAALDSMSGDYCIFIDGDDRISGTFVEELYSMSVRENADIVFADHMLFGDGIDTQESYYGYQGYKVFDRRGAVIDFLTKSGSMSGRLYTKELILRQRFPVGVRTGEDEYVQSGILLRADRVCYNPGAIYYRQVRQGSASRSEFNENDLRALEIREKFVTNIMDNIEDVEGYVSLFMINKYSEVILKIPSDTAEKELDKKLLKRYRYWYRRGGRRKTAGVGMNLRFMLLFVSPRLYRWMKDRKR